MSTTSVDGPVAGEELELTRRQERDVQDGPERPVHAERERRPAVQHADHGRDARPRAYISIASAQSSWYGAAPFDVLFASERGEHERDRRRDQREHPHGRQDIGRSGRRARLAPTMDAMPSPRIILFSSAAFFARPLPRRSGCSPTPGYDGVEVMVTKDPASQDPVQIRALATEHGLTSGRSTRRALLLTRRVWGTDPIAKIDRDDRGRAEAEIPIVVVHPPYRWQRAFRRWLEDRLPDLEATTGVTVAIENMFPRARGRAAT